MIDLEYRKLRDANDEEHDWDQANEEFDKDGERASEAQSRVILAPAPDMDALHFKLTTLYGNEHAPSWSKEYTDALIADAEFLASQ